MKSGLNSKTFDKLSVIAGGIMNPSVQDWKSKGGKVMGYTCSFVPEELIIAAGMLPFRIRGDDNANTANADIYFSSASTCSFVRNCFENIVSGRYNFLDCIAVARTCDVASVIADNLHLSGSKLPVFLLMLPHVSGEDAAQYYKGQLLKFKKALEAESGIEITEDRLRAAVKLCNETRLLQQQFTELLKLPEPPISGSDWSAVLIAGQSMPKEVYNSLLRQLLSCYDPVKPSSAVVHPKRLMLSGACGDDNLVSKIVENLGYVLAYNFTCFGAQCIAGQVDDRGDLLEALARYRLVDHPYCDVLIGSAEKRKAAIDAAVREYAIDGVIGQHLGCCDATAAGMLILREDLKEAGVPCLIFKRDYVSDCSGQITTRIQAFCETLTEGGSK